MSAALALVCGAAFAVAAFLGTRDSAVRQKSANGPAAEQKSPKPSGSERNAECDSISPYALSPRLVLGGRSLFRRLCCAIVLLAAVHR